MIEMRDALFPSKSNVSSQNLTRAFLDRSTNSPIINLPTILYSASPILRRNTIQKLRPNNVAQLRHHKPKSVKQTNSHILREDSHAAVEAKSESA